MTPRDEASRRFQRVRTLFEQALELDPAGREALILRVRSAQPELAAELARMLASLASDTFLEPPLEVTGEAAPMPERIGSFRIVRVLGEGGMGVVYEAWQDMPRRRVALKTLHVGRGGAQRAARLRVEAELLARLDHPGIARVHEAGVLVGPGGEEVPWFAMEYVEGATDLATWLDRTRPGAGARLLLAAQLVDALAHAHRLGIIHRDLKPANVLVDRDGRPRVIDLGVARVLDPEADGVAARTLDGQIVGTLAWMAPEQLEGRPGLVDTRTDVYALGLLLHLLFLGRPPHDTEGLPLSEVARVLREEPALDARSLLRGLPADARWVVRRALERDPERRYQSANELVKDLRCLQEDRPVEAGPPGAAYRLRKLARRHRVALAAGSLALLGLVGGGVLALVGMLEARTEAERYRAIHEVLAEMLTGVRWDRAGSGVLAADLLDDASQGMDRDLAGRPEVEAPLRVLLARSFLALGRDRTAAREAELAVELLERLGEPTDQRLLEAAYLLGIARWRLGDLEGADAVLRRHSGPARRARVSREEPMALSLAHLEGRVLQARGELELADARLRTARERSSELLGPSHRTTLDLGHLLSEVLAARGSGDEAVALARDVLARNLERDGSSAATTHTSRRVLADALLARGERADRAEARQLLEGLLVALARTRGEEHPSTVSVRERLDGLGGTDLASGPGGVRAVPGQPAAEREALLRDRIEALAREVGLEDPSVLEARFELASHLRTSGSPGRAEPLLRDLLADQRRILGDPHLDVAETLEELGTCLFQLGESAQALEFQTANWKQRVELEGARAHRTLRAQVHRATMLGVRGRHAEGRALLTDALDGLRERDPQDPELLVVLLNLVQHHQLAGEAERTEALLEEAARIALLHVPARDPMRVRAFVMLGSLLRLRGEPAEARTWLERAREAALLARDVPASLALEVDRELGRCLAEQGASDEALALLQRAFQRGLERAGRVDGDLAAEARAIADLLEALGRGAEAAQWRSRSAEGAGRR